MFLAGDLPVARLIRAARIRGFLCPGSAWRREAAAEEGPGLAGDARGAPGPLPVGAGEWKASSGEALRQAPAMRRRWEGGLEGPAGRPGGAGGGTGREQGTRAREGGIPSRGVLMAAKGSCGRASGREKQGEVGF